MQDKVNYKLSLCHKTLESKYTVLHIDEIIVFKSCEQCIFAFYIVFAFFKRKLYNKKDKD